MRITVVTAEGRRLSASLPYDHADHVTVAAPCPSCGWPAPIRVRGRGITSHDHDTYYADAEHMGCGGPIGRIETYVSTIFGIEEDEAVLHGRARVY